MILRSHRRLRAGRSGPPTPTPAHNARLQGFFGMLFLPRTRRRDAEGSLLVSVRLRQQRLRCKASRTLRVRGKGKRLHLWFKSFQVRCRWDTALARPDSSTWTQREREREERERERERESARGATSLPITLPKKKKRDSVRRRGHTEIRPYSMDLRAKGPPHVGKRQGRKDRRKEESPSLTSWITFYLEHWLRMQPRLAVAWSRRPINPIVGTDILVYPRTAQG